MTNTWLNHIQLVRACELGALSTETRFRDKLRPSMLDAGCEQYGMAKHDRIVEGPVC